MSEKSTTPDREELVRRSIDALNRGDFDAALVALASDGEWDMSVVGLGVFKGHDAIRGFFQEWIGTYEDYEIELEEHIDFGNDVTFGVALQRGKPQGSSG